MNAIKEAIGVQSKFGRDVEPTASPHQRGASPNTGITSTASPVTAKRGPGRFSKPAPETPASDNEAPDGFGPETPRSDRIVIKAAKFEHATVTIRGTTPLVLHKFSQKAQQSIIATQEAGSQSRKGKAHQARNFQELFMNARHIAKAGWDGIPANAFRNAMISACRTVGFKMTIAKMSIFVRADGFDNEGTGLVRITKGEPFMHQGPGRNANGSIDMRSRPMWEAGWEAVVTLRWDADQFSSSDVVNLLARAGMQVGVGEGRPDSKMSAGCGWGEFEIVS